MGTVLRTHSQTGCQRCDSSLEQQVNDVHSGICSMLMLLGIRKHLKWTTKRARPFTSASKIIRQPFS